MNLTGYEYIESMIECPKTGLFFLTPITWNARKDKGKGLNKDEPLYGQCKCHSKGPYAIMRNANGEVQYYKGSYIPKVRNFHEYNS
jgi:hypothetical protein